MNCPADVNNDQYVDGSDIAGLLGNWGGSGIGDINGSGFIDGLDLAILLAGWGNCP